MRRVFVVVLSVLLLSWGPVPVSALAGVQSVANEHCSSAAGHAHGSSSLQLVENQGRILALQKVTGVEAMRHLEAVRSQHPQAFLRSSENLRGRGFKPTQEVVVLKTVRVDDVITGSGAMAPASTSQGNSEGEVVFWSWDDGDDGTWEGTTYVTKYATGEWATHDSQLNIETTNYWTVWSVKTGGSGPSEEYQVSHPGDQGGGSIMFAVSGQRLSSMQGAPAPGQGPQLAGWQEFQDFIWCSGALCGVCFGTCLASGPLFPGCFTICCGLSVLFCAFNHL